MQKVQESTMPERAGCIIGGRFCDEFQRQDSEIDNIGPEVNATKTDMMVIDAESDADQVITIAGKILLKDSSSWDQY